MAQNIDQAQSPSIAVNNDTEVSIEKQAPVEKQVTFEKEVESTKQEDQEEDIDTIEDPVTIFSNPNNFNIKHPLQNAWSFWYDSPSKKKSLASWSQNLKKIITVDTVEDFWGVFNNISKASELANGANYHLFREGVKPEWEDKANSQGGKWVFQAKKGKYDMDNLWLYTLLACIGEAFDINDELNGVIFSARRELYRISIWTRNCDNQDLVTELGHKFKEVLGIKSETIDYTSHSDGGLKYANKNGKYTI
ncbi:eukaryotic translation initiation factor 4E [Neoconidiobolus thromboides FSU 785]|nr:eukaryotic translation initiation factor 4E [Neoconidiobolus thromboides FSU 785]